MVSGQGGVAWWIDWMILVFFSNLHESVILGVRLKLSWVRPVVFAILDDMTEKKLEVCTITEITESYSLGKGISTLFSKIGFCAICLYAGTYSPASLFSRACKFSEDASASEHASVPLQIFCVLTWALIKHTMFGLGQQKGNLTKLVTAAPRPWNYFSVILGLLFHFPLGIVE